MTEPDRYTKHRRRRQERSFCTSDNMEGGIKKQGVQKQAEGKNCPYKIIMPRRQNFVIESVCSRNQPQNIFMGMTI